MGVLKRHNQFRKLANQFWIRLNKSHTGVYLTEKLAQSLKEYGIHEKVSIVLVSVHVWTGVLIIHLCEGHGAHLRQRR